MSELFSADDIASFIDSDEVSSIDGIKLTKSKSYTHLVSESDKQLRRTASYTGSALLQPEAAEKLKRQKNKASSRDRSEDDDDAESSEQRRRKHRKEPLDRDNLLALPIRDPSLVKKLLPPKSHSKSSEDESYEVSQGGTRRRKKKHRSKHEYAGVERSGSAEHSEWSERSGSVTPGSERSEKSERSERSERSEKKTLKNTEDPHTKEEIQALTDGFFLVPKYDWYTLEPGCCIKWVNKHGRCVKKEWYYWYQRVSKVTGGNFFYVGQYPNQALTTQMKMAIFWDNIKYLYRKEDPGTKLLRQAIDKRQDYINDLAIFLREKYGEDFEKYMNKRGQIRQKKHAEQQAIEKAKLADRQKEDTAKVERLRAADKKKAETASKTATKKVSKTEPKKITFLKRPAAPAYTGPATSASSTKPASSATSAKPASSATSAKPIRIAKSTKSTKSTKPAKPMKPSTAKKSKFKKGLLNTFKRPSGDDNINSDD